MIPNAFDAVEGEYAKNDFISGKKKIYGYVGTVAEWFDNKAIELIAENPRHKVIFLGYVKLGKMTVKMQSMFEKLIKRRAQSICICLLHVFIHLKRANC